MKAEVSVEIDRPIGEVFPIATGKVAEWSITVVEDEVIEKKPGEVGTTFRCVTEERGRRMEFIGTVTVHEPPSRSAVVLRGKHFDLDVEYVLEDLGGRTRLTQRSEIHGKGFAKVMFFLLGWLLAKSGKKAGEKELASLKEYCEAVPVE